MCERESGSRWLLSGRTAGRPVGSLPTYNSFMDMPGGGQLYHALAMCHPVHRYLAEYRSNKQRPQTWWRKCNRRKVGERYPCDPPDSLESFLKCPNNPALNRVTRMLAYGQCALTRIPPDPFIERYLLDTAMMTLENFTFVGVDEFASASEGLLFESLNLQGTDKHSLASNQGLTEQFNITEEQYKEIINLNHLDMKLYYHAIRVMAARAEYSGVYEGLFAELQFPTDMPGPWDSALGYYLQKGLYLP